MADPTYTTTWGFQSAEPLNVINGGSDDGLVTEVHWNLTCVSSDNLTGYYYAVMDFEKGDTVTPLKDLTKDQVISWIKNKLGSDEVAKLESDVKQQIIDKRTPATKLTAPSSWSS